jgi:23S rRNA (cytidine1920-2'-O)/16S rRNA (cytidine1409-2'-O)-methyltransferase
MEKERLDILVQRQAGVSRSKAQGLIQTGKVTGPDGFALTKPGQRLETGAELQIEDDARFVSRGGEKLLAALEAFPLPVQDAVAIDVGASTGGFTDCLLQHGAEHVYAVDVGYGQLAWKLREDPRVTVMERTNIRNLSPEELDTPPNLFVADCSFISLRLVLPSLKALLSEGAEGVVLIKPQFEAGKDQVGKGGVVRDAHVHDQVIENVLAAAVEMGFANRAVVPSPLLGPAGNKEFLAHLQLTEHA